MPSDLMDQLLAERATRASGTSSTRLACTPVAPPRSRGCGSSSASASRPRSASATPRARPREPTYDGPAPSDRHLRSGAPGCADRRRLDRGDCGPRLRPRRALERLRPSRSGPRPWRSSPWPRPCRSPPLLTRSESWHVCVRAAGGTVSRRRVYRAASVATPGTSSTASSGSPCGIAALRRNAPTECPRPSRSRPPRCRS